MARRAAVTTLMHRLLPASAPPRLAPPFLCPTRSCSGNGEFDWSKDPREMISYLGDWSLTEQAMKHPGMDYRHWFVEVVRPGRLKKYSKEARIWYFGQILNIVLPDIRPSDLEKKIYKVVFDTENPGFGCEIDWDTAIKLQEVSEVRKVSLDYYPDPKYKDYGGELVVNGMIVERSEPKLKVESA